MGLLDKDSELEIFNYVKEAFDMSCVVECTASWQEATVTHDDVNNVDVLGTPVTKTKDVLIIDNEEKRNGMATSSQIVEGVPTGTHKIYLKIEDAIYIDEITNYVDKSLKFIVRPTTKQPITLYPDVIMSKIEYFMENGELPLNQRFICKLMVTS